MQVLADSRVSNEDTWKNSSLSEWPSIEWMRKLLDELRKDSSGSEVNVRKRFIRAFAKEDIVATSDQWQIKKASNALRGSKANGETWRNVHPINCPTTYAMRRLLKLYGKSSCGSDDVVRKRFKWIFAKENVAFVGDRWEIQNMWCPIAFEVEGHDMKDAAVVNQETSTPEEGYGDSCICDKPYPEIGEDWDVSPSIKDSYPVYKESPRDVMSFVSANENALVDESSFDPLVPVARKLDSAIDIVYKRLYTPNKNFDNNGGSTYAEITRFGVSQIIDTIKNVFFPLLTKPERDNFRAVDLGAGFLTCLAHIAQVIPGEYIGIENDARRAWLFAVSYQRLLKEHPHEVCNTKIAYFHMDIFDLDCYECDLVYTFDEAFPRDLWLKIVKTFRASPRCKFLIMFKVAKSFPECRAWNQELRTLAGVTLVDKLSLSKKGGESSNAAFFVKDDLLHRDTKDTNVECLVGNGNHEASRTSGTVWEQCRPFWGCHELAHKTVSQLTAKIASQLHIDKCMRKM